MDEVLIIDKPSGITSHDVVNRVRRVAQERRVGHAGTLDPFATGVLVVCVGRSTRLSQYLVGLDKRYRATVRLGFATDTQDLTGKQITPLLSSKHLTADEIEAVIAEFTGPLKQMPPMYSAKKVDGRRLYEAARKGEEIERKQAPITVYSLSMKRADPGGSEREPIVRNSIVENSDGTRDFVMEVHCSSGTYVRTLAHDIGNQLRVGAHLAGLQRTAVGHLGLDRAVSLRELETAGKPGVERFGVSGSDALCHIPPLEVTPEESRRLANGVGLNVVTGSTGYRLGEMVRLVDGSARLVAVGEVVGVDGGAEGDTAIASDAGRRVIRPRMVMASAEDKGLRS